jgi:hypothetical protein
MMDLSLNWQGIAAIVAITGAMSAVAMVLIRNNLRGEFVEQGDFDLMATRVTSLEGRVIGAPKHDDLRSLTSRFSGLETAMAGIAATQVASRESQARIERMVEMLVKNELEGEHK